MNAANAESRLILVTGVSRGLGLALVGEFVRRGHTVLGCARDGGAMVELGRRHGSPHDFALVDVADDATVKSWAARLLASHGPPDLLINNAALVNRNAPLWQVPAADFDRVVDVNLKGVANVIRHFVPAMVAKKKGVIVNVSSGWGRSVAPEVAPYCMSKWAIEGLTKALAEELPAGMAAVPLNPGVIDTDMLRSCWADGAASYPKAEQWAKVAAPFILKLGPKHNGQSLSVGE